MFIGACIEKRDLLADYSEAYLGRQISLLVVTSANE